MTSHQLPAPDEPIGRREANKRATREALTQAAQTLFAEQGFAATTVRNIADAAGVTERTFFRYFDSKEELILDDILAGLPRFQQAIRDRPANEAPLLAVHRAVAQLARTGLANRPLQLFLDGPPAQRLGGAGSGFILRVETALADALTDRLANQPSPAAAHDDAGGELAPIFRAQLAARVSVAVLRSILIRDTQLHDTPARRRPTLHQLIDQAFTTVE